MLPLVSIIIPVFNRLSFLNEAIESVIAQTYSPYEIIVVDDGSTEDVRKNLEPYGEAVKYLRKNNGGPSSARNFGVLKTQGDFLVFLDSDDEFMPEKLERQVSIMLENPDIGLVYSDEFLLSSSGLTEKVPMRTERTTPLPSGNIALDFFKDSFIGIMTVCLRRSVFVEMGGFDESLLYNEDDDLWFRIMLKYPVICSDYVSGARRLHDTNMSRDRAKMTFYQLYCIEKYIDSFPYFISDNCSDVKKRVSSIMSDYWHWCVIGCRLPHLKIIFLNSLIKKRLNRLLSGRLRDDQR